MTHPVTPGRFGSGLININSAEVEGAPVTFVRLGLSLSKFQGFRSPVSETEPSPIHISYCVTVSQREASPVVQLGTEAVPRPVVDSGVSAFTLVPSSLPVPGSPGVSSGLTPALPLCPASLPPPDGSVFNCF